MSVAARAPWCSARATQIYWSTLGLFERRLVRRFGEGRVWLAGDAAHQAAPIGVHSMNAGLVEARELAARIARIQHGEGGPALLTEFATTSHDSWRSLLGGAVQPRAGADPWVRQNAARILACLPASGEDVGPLLEQIHLSSPGFTEAGA